MNNNFRFPYTSRNDIFSHEHPYQEALRNNEQFRVPSNIGEVNVHLKNNIEKQQLKKPGVILK